MQNIIIKTSNQGTKIVSVVKQQTVVEKPKSLLNDKFGGLY
jgi:hypothetical protein